MRVFAEQTVNDLLKRMRKGTPPPGAATARQDARLLEMIEDFNAFTKLIAAEKRGHTLSPDHAASEVAIELWHEQQEALLGRICAVRALTPAGLRARAESLCLWAPRTSRCVEEDDNPEHDWEDRMIAALLRDIRAGA